MLPLSPPVSHFNSIQRKTHTNTHTHPHTRASFKQGPPGGIVNSQQIVWRECEMGRREMMERCADRREGAPEGEAMISGGGRASEEWKNKRVCGCCYLKGLDKVSVTGSVRSSIEADVAARLSEVRLMGLKVNRPRFGWSAHTPVKMQMRTDMQHKPRAGRQMYQEAR